MSSKLIEYWDHRHKHGDEWTSGGDRSFSIERNKAFYLHRLGVLLGLIDQAHGGRRLQILDAGCGKGWLTEQLYLLGHDVEGVDGSDTAIEICRAHRNGAFLVEDLSNYHPSRLVDVVICLDVLFHILDGDEWSKTIVRLANALEFNGTFVLTDDPCSERYTLGDYIVHRSISEYIELFSSLGFELVQDIPYNFGGNPNHFLAFRRKVITT